MSLTELNGDRDQPILETTLEENIAIKKFLTFALEDVKYQLKILARSGLSQKQFNSEKRTAELLGVYLIGLMTEVDAQIAQFTPTTETVN